jgi:hypothetical protein
MKLFSLSNLVAKASETFRRFPLPLLAAVATTVTMICVMETIEPGDHILNQLFWRIAAVLSLFTVTSIALALSFERFSVSQPRRLIFYGVLAVAVALYFVSLPDELHDTSSIRWLSLVVAVHALVSFSPFLFRNEMNGMWQFNKSLFIHFLISAVYSVVLYLGLAGALAAVKVLFELHIEPKYFADLWFVIAGIFNTWFFLTGVPRDIPALDKATDCPKGLKVFTVHVLLPLISVYLVILYLYAAKILITQDWPVGWVAYMVMAFSGFGILSFLLLYPLRNDETNRWVKVYSRLFYYLLILPLIMLYISIFKRINMYGWTVDRYFVILLALWLTYITIYLIVTSGRNIRMIPLSLCVVAVLSTFGPWGAFDISHKSQMFELTELFSKQQMLSGGKVKTDQKYEMSDKNADRMRSIITYMIWMHGYKTLQPLYTQNLDSVIMTKSVAGSHPNLSKQKEAILELVDIKENRTFDSEDRERGFEVRGHDMFSAAGYDYTAVYNVVFTGRMHNEPTMTKFKVGADSVEFIDESAKNTFTIKSATRETLVLHADSMIATLFNDSEQQPAERLTLSAENDQWKARLCFAQITIGTENHKSTITRGHSMLMLKFKDTK